MELAASIKTNHLFMKCSSIICISLVVIACGVTPFATAQTTSSKRLLIPSLPVMHKSIQLASGIHLEYAEKGGPSGIPVIFLHGFADSWHSFDMILPLLPASVHAYVLSQRGHGNSDRPLAGYKPEDFAADIAGFMQKLNIESAFIVGHSMGATVAQRFVLDYPERTRGLVLIGSFASYKKQPVIDELREIIAKLEDPIDSGFVHEFQKSTLFKPISETAMKTFVSESMKVPAHIWKSAGDGVLVVDYSDELKHISSPTLIIWGDQDKYCPQKDQYTIKAAIRNSTLLIYEGVGHAIHWEDPERFTNDFLDFIQKAHDDQTAEIDIIAEYSQGSFY
jgi:pimeloyl-ACP methyl ester carboxylesterase